MSTEWGKVHPLPSSLSGPPVVFWYVPPSLAAPSPPARPCSPILPASPTPLYPAFSASLTHPPRCMDAHSCSSRFHTNGYPRTPARSSSPPQPTAPVCSIPSPVTACPPHEAGFLQSFPRISFCLLKSPGKPQEQHILPHPFCRYPAGAPSGPVPVPEPVPLHFRMLPPCPPNRVVPQQPCYPQLLFYFPDQPYRLIPPDEFLHQGGNQVPRPLVGGLVGYLVHYAFAQGE